MFFPYKNHEIGNNPVKYRFNSRSLTYFQTFSFLHKMVLEWELDIAKKFSMIHTAL
jgi:hypothetical protein